MPTMPAHACLSWQHQATIPIDRPVYYWRVYVCVCVCVCMCVLCVCLLVRVSVFPFKITPSSPVMSQCTCAQIFSPSPLTPQPVIVAVREHWQVWAQLCFSLSGACRAPGMQEWPGAAAAVTPGISFPDKPARNGERKCGGCRVPPACR